MKTQALLKTIFGTAFIALLLLMISCDDQSALVGRWVAVSGEDNGGVMDLLSDGIGTVTLKGIQEGFAFTWKTEKDRLYIINSGLAKSFSYKLQGSELTFIEDDGKISKYMKCKKDCQETAKEFQQGQN